MEFNWLAFIVVLIVNLIIVVTSICLSKKKQDRIFLAILNFPIYLYSGFGLCLFEIDTRVVFLYLFFIGVLNTVLVCFLNKKTKIKIINHQKINLFFDSPKGVRFVNISVFIIFVSLIIQLLSLGIGIKEFVNFSIFDLRNIFEKVASTRENIITYIFSLIEKLLIPFLFIKIYILVENKKKLTAILLFLLWIYLDALKIGYVGRYKMVVFVLFLGYLIFVKKGALSIKKIIPVLLILFLAIPLMLAYEDYRQGRDFILSTDFVSAAEKLIRKEVDYPQYYTKIIDADIMKPTDYFIWLATLSIPKEIISVNAISINTEFSFYITRLKPGDPYYSIILPSIFGEAIIIYGLFFSWFHGVFLGLFLAFFIRYYRRFKHLSFLTTYLIIHSISIGRGGSQGTIAYFINASLLFIIFSFLMKYIKINEIEEIANENINNFNCASR